MLPAEFAEIALFGRTPAEGALRSVLGPDGEQLVDSTDLSEAGALALERASAQDAAILLPRGREPHVLDGYLAEHGIEDAIVTALRREDRIFCMLLVGDWARDGSTFYTDDRQLFETFSSPSG